MSDFAIRAGSIDVEEIMRHIRTRIRDKRGIDYTDKEIRELANVKLERILDPTGIRSDLFEHFRQRPKSARLNTAPVSLAPWPAQFPFDDKSIYASTRGLLLLIRRLLRPVLKLLFNPNPLITVIHQQSLINAHTEGQLQAMADQLSEQIAGAARARDETDTLNYEVLNNLVVEITRLGIEVKNLKMQVQSVSSRLDFDERRARALESLVKPAPDGPPPEAAAPTGAADTGDGSPNQKRRRRRRRGGRRRGAETAATGAGGEVSGVTQTAEATPAGDPSDADAAPVAPQPAPAPPVAQPDSTPSVTESTPPEAAAPTASDDGPADTPDQ